MVICFPCRDLLLTLTLARLLIIDCAFLNTAYAGVDDWNFGMLCISSHLVLSGQIVRTIASHLHFAFLSVAVSPAETNYLDTNTQAKVLLISGSPS